MAPCEQLHRALGPASLIMIGIGCLIMEPISSSFGYVPAQPEFLQGVRKLTEELGIVLVFDEVQSLRVAPGGAQDLFGITPDLTALGKIIGGGMPVGAFGGRRDIMAQFDPTQGPARIAHAGTFNANPMTLVAGEVGDRCSFGFERNRSLPVLSNGGDDINRLVSPVNSSGPYRLAFRRDPGHDVLRENERRGHRGAGNRRQRHPHQKQCAF